MRNMTSALSSSSIAALCLPAAKSVSIEVVAETGSTNTDLLARIGSLSGPTLLLAEAQTAGRGRAGRGWYSAPGDTLTFSLAWKFKRSLHDLMGLPLAVGVVIANALASFGVKVQLKWPNDILKDEGKLGGVLIETAIAQQLLGSEVWAVIGIGINLAVPGIEVTGQPASAANIAEADRNAFMAALVSELCAALTVFDDQGFIPFMAQWNKLHAYAGLAVTIIDGGEVLHEGTAIGVDHIGRLLLDTGEGQIAVIAGDVSLRVTARAEER
jgi:BirA family biotin operon repressor/biotin-[acetyl-CoA-carboxylase] ligase